MCQVYQESHEHECPVCRKDFDVDYDEDASEIEKQEAHPSECPYCDAKLVWDHDSHVAFPAMQMSNIKPVEIEETKEVEIETTR